MSFPRELPIIGRGGAGRRPAGDRPPDGGAAEEGRGGSGRGRLAGLAGFVGRRPAGTARAGEVGRRPGADVDARGLARELRQAIRGEIRFDSGDRALYAADAANYRHVPIGVVIPQDKDDVAEVVRVCREFGAPVLARGAGTSLGGQCCNVAIVIDFSKYMNHLLAVDPDARTARVEPGMIRDAVAEATAEHGLVFAPDTATHRWATIGGMVGNNSCGIHSVMAGRTQDNVEELEVLTFDGVRMRVGNTPEDEVERIVGEGGRRGEIYGGLRDLRDRYADLIRARFPDIPRRVSGYSLDALLPENGFHVARALVGSEGTCVAILDATLRLVPVAQKRVLLVLGYPDVYQAGDHVPEVLEAGPIGLEGIDDLLVRFLKRKRLHDDRIPLLPHGGGWLLVEFGGETLPEAAERARALMDRLGRQEGAPSMKLFEDEDEQESIWKIRESGLGATAFVPAMDDAWPGWEDSAVPPDRVGEYLRALRDLYDKYDYRASLYGHFGDGCIHTRINFDLTSAGGIRKYRAFVDEAADLVVHLGGSLSGEHGDGQARSELLSKMYGDELVQAFGEFKAIWDPEGMMNPGRIVEPYAITADLRLGTDYNPPRPDTHFEYPDDGGDFSRAALRCVGVGQCRKTDGGTMCPSYMVLREEKHTTRGRAHLLFEMLQGDPVSGGWRDERVKESLDLCLSCKGCTGECPVKVDIPTYKAEFFAHYYQGRVRPRHNYAFGLIHWWARAASRMPRVVNFFAQTPGFREVAHAAAGMARQRDIPKFATRTFRAWFRERTDGNVSGTRVMLWPDTFTNFFEPDVARAAVEVLEDAGCHVVLPGSTLCCGRPLYEYGMLDLAKWHLRRSMDVLRDEIRAGTPVVGLEPSCIAVFRDELSNLFARDDDARRLRKQAFTLGEYLDSIDYEPPPLEMKAVVHGHCHQKAVLNDAVEAALLERMGLETEVLDSGCCGMAGAFGYQAGEPYEVSVGAGERVLLPAVRAAAPETLIVANGFSCRSQIRQSTEREPLHLAQLLRMALRKNRPKDEHDWPGEGMDGRPSRPRRRVAGAAMVGAGLMAGGAVALQLTRHRSG